MHMRIHLPLHPKPNTSTPQVDDSKHPVLEINWQRTSSSSIFSLLSHLSSQEHDLLQSDLTHLGLWQLFAEKVLHIIHACTESRCHFWWDKNHQYISFNYKSAKVNQGKLSSTSSLYSKILLFSSVYGREIIRVLITTGCTLDVKRYLDLHVTFRLNTGMQEAVRFFWCGWVTTSPQSLVMMLQSFSRKNITFKAPVLFQVALSEPGWSLQAVQERQLTQLSVIS